MTRARKAVSFIGTIVVALGALIAATVAAIIITTLFNAMSTQPYITAGDAYYTNATNFTQLHVLFYNVGKGGAYFQYMYIYIPTNISGTIKTTVVKVLVTGEVINNTSGTVIGFANFTPSIAIQPQGVLEMVIQVNNLNANTTATKILGIAVFDRDSVVVTFDKI